MKIITSVAGDPVWVPIVGLAALGITGKAWGLIAECGGPAQVWETDSLLVEVFQTQQSRQRVLNFSQGDPDSASALRNRAKPFFRPVELFVGRGGRVLGTHNLAELGRLTRSPQVPLCAFLKGQCEHIYAKPQVAIVGSREANARGIAQTFELARAVTGAGCLVVSGGALGVDTAAHQGALAMGGGTLGIMGNPLSRSGMERPTRLQRLLSPECFTALTVYGPWVYAGATLFVTRNQYVAAMADAVVVMQGKEDSGALYTAKYAHAMGIPVWAIPGDVADTLYAAPNGLLESGKAKVLVKTETLLKTLVQRQKTSDTGSLVVPPTPDSLPDHRVLQALKRIGGRASLDDLCEALHQPAACLQLELLELELEGRLRKQGGELMLASV